MAHLSKDVSTVLHPAILNYFLSVCTIPTRSPQKFTSVLLLLTLSWNCAWKRRHTNPDVVLAHRITEIWSQKKSTFFSPMFYKMWLVSSIGNLQHYIKLNDSKHAFATWKEAQVHFEFRTIEKVVTGFAIFAPVFFLLAILRPLTDFYFVLKDEWSVFKMHINSICC